MRWCCWRGLGRDTFALRRMPRRRHLTFMSSLCAYLPATEFTVMMPIYWLRLKICSLHDLTFPNWLKTRTRHAHADTAFGEYSPSFHSSRLSWLFAKSAILRRFSSAEDTASTFVAEYNEKRVHINWRCSKTIYGYCIDVSSPRCKALPGSLHAYFNYCDDSLLIVSRTATALLWRSAISFIR